MKSEAAYLCDIFFTFLFYYLSGLTIFGHLLQTPGVNLNQGPTGSCLSICTRWSV